MSGDAYVGIPSVETFVNALRTEVGQVDSGKMIYRDLLIVPRSPIFNENKWVNSLCFSQVACKLVTLIPIMYCGVH
jgi:hypothetical protein